MNFKNHIVLLLVLVLATPLLSLAQNNTSSPYSVFGAGDLSNVAYGRALGLGGTGYALRSSNFLNFKNPASLTAIDTLSTLFETGVFGKYTQNASNEAVQDFWDGNITHLALGHRYTSWLMGNYGFMPYSDIGYNFRTNKFVSGEESRVVTDWKGTGGISRFFYGVGLKVHKYFSLGGEVAYYYGPVNESRSTTAEVQPENSTIYNTNTPYSGLSYKGAFQLIAPLGKKGSGLTLGGVFSPGHRLGGTSNVTIQQNYGSAGGVIIRSEEEKARPIQVPVSYGGGLALTWRNKYLLTSDLELENWSSNTDQDYINREVISAGFELLPQNSLNYFERCSYRVGFRYDSGYFRTKGYAIDDVRFTMGVGFPVQKSRSTINVSLEAGQRGTNNMGLIRERYTKLTVAFSFHDYWFVQRKID